MEQNRFRLSYKNKKEIFMIVHIISIFALLALFSLIYLNKNFHIGIFTLNQKRYEDSIQFVQNLEEDIRSIFDYERYRLLFENNNKFDKNQKMFAIYEGPDVEKIYTLEDVLNYAKKIGYYINEDYQVTRVYEGVEDSDNTRYLVTWERYAPNKNIQEPGEAYKTLEGLCNEVLGRLSKYYRGYKNLKEQDRNIYYTLDYSNHIFTNRNNLNEKTYKNYGKYIHVSSESIIIDTNLVKIPKNIYIQANKGILIKNSKSENIQDKYNIYICVDTNYPKKDSYYFNNLTYKKERAIYFKALVGIMIFSIISLYTLFYLVCTSGLEEKKSKNIKLYVIDKYSIELRIFMALVCIITLWFISERVIYKFIHAIMPEELWIYGEKSILYIIIYFISFACVCSLVRSYKSAQLWEKSFIKHLIDDGCIYRKTYSFTKRLASNFILYYLINLFTTIIIFYLVSNETTLIERLISIILVIILIAFNIFAFNNMYKRAVANDKIFEKIKDISDGIINKKLDLSEFSGKEKEVAIKLNNIGEGFANAMNEHIKSERLKADLITNVSHDIRTPLTSIINYIDLIKRANTDDFDIRPYIDILETKSLYLKNLIEDLIEASKVSSGNIKIELQEIDFVQLIQQVNGEFKEKYAERGLDIISKLPKDKMIIKADGRYLWRVLENLYNNNYKYATENSRIYIDLLMEDNIAILSIKNISERQLNISPNELTMRFVRGDVSRSTEGSGLGLSIAKSLTLIQGGSFDISIDGDLFKVKLSFPLIDKSQI